MSPFGKRSHRHYRYRGSHNRARLPVWAIIGICVAAALIVSLIVGNLLRVFLDEDAYRRLVEGKPEPPEISDPVKTSVPDVMAYPFVLGSPTDTLKKNPAVSVALNAPDGTLTYSSPVAAHFSLPQTEGIALGDAMSALTPVTSYVSGIFYPQAFAQADDALFDAVRAEEHALLREFANTGADEILLVGTDPSLSSLKRLADYASTLRESLGEGVYVGVSIPLSSMQADNGWETVGTLLKSCDFCALDLRGIPTETDESAEKLLADITYYRLQYDMRLLLTANQGTLLSAIGQSEITDYEVVGN